MSETNQDVQTADGNHKRISRRDFLKLAGLGIGALALKPIIDKTANIWQPKVVELGINALENPAVMESVLGNSAGSLEALALRIPRSEESSKIGINPSYKPMAEIIGEVLDKRRSEGKSISYQRIDGYENLPYYLDKLRIAARDPENRDRSIIETGQVPVSSYILGYDPSTFSRLLNNTDFFPKEVKNVWDMSNYQLFTTWEIVRYDSGFLDQVSKLLGEESREILKTHNLNDDEQYALGLSFWKTHQNEIDQVVRTYLQNIKQHVETVVTQTGTPVSAGEIFSHCLDRNSGSINKSLADTKTFLEYMARSDITLNTLNTLVGNPEGLKDNEDWFKINIKDEYGKIGNYSELTHLAYPYNGFLSGYKSEQYVVEDESLINQIGKPYHTWNIAALLSALPPTMIRVGVAYRQFITFNEQGSVKTASDFRTALELDKLNSLFVKI